MVEGFLLTGTWFICLETGRFGSGFFFPACTIKPKQYFENFLVSRKKTFFFVGAGKL